MRTTIKDIGRINKDIETIKQCSNSRKFAKKRTKKM